MLLLFGVFTIFANHTGHTFTLIVSLVQIIWCILLQDIPMTWGSENLRLERQTRILKYTCLTPTLIGLRDNQLKCVCKRGWLYDLFWTFTDVFKENGHCDSTVQCHVVEKVETLRNPTNLHCLTLKTKFRESTKIDVAIESMALKSGLLVSKLNIGLQGPRSVYVRFERKTTNARAVIRLNWIFAGSFVQIRFLRGYVIELIYETPNCVSIQPKPTFII